MHECVLVQATLCRNCGALIGWLNDPIFVAVYSPSKAYVVMVRPEVMSAPVTTAIWFISVVRLVNKRDR
jgi:hypothetical protein